MFEHADCYLRRGISHDEEVFVTAVVARRKMVLIGAGSAASATLEKPWHSRLSKSKPNIIESLSALSID